MTFVHLVRHGVTAVTGRRLSGRTPDIHLSEEGRFQAEAAASFLAGVPLKALYSSPIERCYETAEIVARPHKHLSVEVLDDIIEVDYGRWSDRTFSSIKRTKMWRTVQRVPSAIRFPEGEAIRDVQTRTVKGVERLAEKHKGSHICCVSHADVIRLALAHYLGVHVDLYQRLVIAPGSVSVIAIGEGGPRVFAVNQTPPGVGKDPA